MPNRPDLTSIIKKMQNKKSFKMRPEQYFRETGYTFPESLPYAVKNSSVAKCAGRHGYSISIDKLYIKFTYNK